MTHGLGGNSGEWVYMATRFAAKGYCAFALDYGHLDEVPFLNGLDDLRTSADQLSDFVDKGNLTMRLLCFLHSTYKLLIPFYFSSSVECNRISKS